MLPMLLKLTKLILQDEFLSKTLQSNAINLLMIM